ncbi:MAG: multicopper oxidase domain-containing protein [Verrucomicrobiota bacterium]
MPFGPTIGLLGVVNPDASGEPVMWEEAVTENPAVGSTEIWEIHNFTEDAHPIHLHQTQFEVVNRQASDGSLRGPETWETGTKDVIIAYPNEITRVKTFWDIPGRYVWHCHILEHEDNEMMRPLHVGPVPV